MIIESLKEDIYLIVHNHSGGIKFTELIASLVSSKSVNRDSSQFVDDVIDTIADMPNSLKVLKYSWYQTEDSEREKLFIYTP